MESPVPACRVSSVAVCFWRHVCPHPVLRLLGLCRVGKGMVRTYGAQVLRAGQGDSLFAVTLSLPHAAPASATPQGSLALWRDWMTVTAHLTAPSGALLDGAGRSSREAQQAGLLEARRKPRAPILPSPGSPQPQPPGRFLGTQFENHGTHSTGVRW